MANLIENAQGFLDLFFGRFRCSLRRLDSRQLLFGLSQVLLDLHVKGLRLLPQVRVARQRGVAASLLALLVESADTRFQCGTLPLGTLIRIGRRTRFGPRQQPGLELFSCAGPVDDLADELKREAQKRFAVGLIVFARRGTELHVPSARVHAPLSAGPAVHERAATFGQIHDAAGQRVLGQVFDPRHAALRVVAAEGLLPNTLPSLGVESRLEGQRAADQQARGIANDLGTALFVAVGVAQNTVSAVAKPEVLTLRPPAVVENREHRAVLQEFLDGRVTPESLDHARLAPGRPLCAGSRAQNTPLVEVIGDPLIAPPLLLEDKHLDPVAELGRVFRVWDPPNVTSLLPHMLAAWQILQDVRVGIYEGPDKSVGRIAADREAGLGQ